MKSEYIYQVGAETKTVTIEPEGEYFRVTVGEAVYQVAAAESTPGQLNLTLDNQRLQVYVARKGSRRYVALLGKTWLLERPQVQPRRRGPGASATSGSGQLEATMPGQVLAVEVAEGDAVERGQTLLLLEAMKMELRITAPFAGQVNAIHCNVGQVVEREQILLEIVAHA